MISHESSLAVGSLALPVKTKLTATDILYREFGDTIRQTDMRLVAEQLRDIGDAHGLGVAMMVAHQHGIASGHIPLIRSDSGTLLEPQVTKIVDPDSPYLFVNVPVREFRADMTELSKRKIMNPRPRTSGFVYHEDGLIGTFTFDIQKLSSATTQRITQADIKEILSCLEAQKILRAADLNSKQVHFKDTRSKRFLESSNEQVYVKGDKPLKEMWLPDKYNIPAVKEYLISRLQHKGPCNYCSCVQLNPLEATVESAELKQNAGSAIRPVRNYMLGFTFAPFGDPRDVKHFLGWDYPHIHQIVNNMDPQSYSFSDLILLVERMNKEWEKFCNKHQVEFEPISGVCNHWAGNSIYHQHYQFFCIPEIPILKAQATNTVAAHGEVKIERLGWEMPAYRISAGSGDITDLMAVANEVASVWAQLNGDKKDLSYGNGIEINNHTQNIFVSYCNGQVEACFIPRMRTHLNTANKANVIQKNNAAVLEALGYFLIDSKDDLELLHGRISNECFKNELKGLSVTSPELVKALQTAGYLDANQKVQSQVMSIDKLVLDLSLSAEMLVVIHTKLKLAFDMTPLKRKELAIRWLNELSPNNDRIMAFETLLTQRISEAVFAYKKDIREASEHSNRDARRRKLTTLAVEIAESNKLNRDQTTALLGELDVAYSQTADVQGAVLLSAKTIALLVAKKVN